MPTTPTLEKEFDAAMMDLYKKAKAIGFPDERFHNMIYEDGGVATAKLLKDAEPHPGFFRLRDMGYLQLTVEYLVASEPEYRSLFPDEERRAAQRRYKKYAAKAV